MARMKKMASCEISGCSARSDRFCEICGGMTCHQHGESHRCPVYDEPVPAIAFAEAPASGEPGEPYAQATQPEERHASDEAPAGDHGVGTETSE